MVTYKNFIENIVSWLDKDNWVADDLTTNRIHSSITRKTFDIKKNSS